MNAASLGLCKELYELSGWDRTDKSWWIEQWGKNDAEVSRYAHKQDEDDNNSIHFPAYDLGYLLRRLPSTSVTNYSGVLRDGVPYQSWSAQYYSDNIVSNAETPEDAACKLAIELFKRGILEPGDE